MIKRGRGRPKITYERQSLSLKLPSELYLRLKEHSEKTGVTQTFILWKALEGWLDNEQSERVRKDG